MNDACNLIADERGLHEATHAVAAVEAMMLGIVVRLTDAHSPRGVPTDADITYSCPQLDEEPIWRMLQRKLFVTLAGPAWEAYLAAELDTCRPALQRQRDDRLAAYRIIRQLLRAGVHGSGLKTCVQESWNAARTLPTRRNQHIIAISRRLQKAGELNDCQIRSLFAEASIRH